MRNTVIIAILFTLVSSGCATQKSRAKNIRAIAAPAALQQLGSLNVELVAAKAKATQTFAAVPAATAAGVTEPVMKSRIDKYGELQKEKQDLDAVFKASFDEKGQTANKVANIKTGIGLGGLASGIAAAALTAASPANAVYVVVFAGFAGGVAGMNNVFDANGYSREQIAALESTVVQQYAKASSAMHLAVLLDKALNPATSFDDWQKAVDEQEGALNQLRALSYTLRMPTLGGK